MTRRTISADAWEWSSPTILARRLQRVELEQRTVVRRPGEQRARDDGTQRERARHPRRPASEAPSVEASLAIPSFELPSDDKGLEALLPDQMCGKTATKASMSGDALRGLSDTTIPSTLNKLGKSPKRRGLRGRSSASRATAATTPRSSSRSRVPIRVASVTSSSPRPEGQNDTTWTPGQRRRQRRLHRDAGVDPTKKTYAYFHGDALFIVEAPDDACGRTAPPGACRDRPLTVGRRRTGRRRHRRCLRWLVVLDWTRLDGRPPERRGSVVRRKRRARGDAADERGWGHPADRIAQRPRPVSQRQYRRELPDADDRRARRLAGAGRGCGRGRHGRPDPDRGRPVQRRNVGGDPDPVRDGRQGRRPQVELANTTIGGKSVTTATYPNSHTGPVVAYVTGDTLYLLQSSNPALVEDALKQLP